VPEGAPQHSTLDLSETYAVESAESSFKDLIDALFCRSWTAYLSAKEKTQRQFELQEFVESQLKERATAPVAMEIDQITTNSPELADAVQAQVAKHTKSLQSQVSRLTNQLNGLKNISSGASKESRALTKKKSDSAKQAAKPTPVAQKAAAAVSDTPASKTRPPRGNGKRTRKKKSKPKNSSS
jgi:prophage DNA circulation protein